MLLPGKGLEGNWCAGICRNAIARQEWLGGWLSGRHRFSHPGCKERETPHTYTRTCYRASSSGERSNSNLPRRGSAGRGCEESRGGYGTRKLALPQAGLAGKNPRPDAPGQRLRTWYLGQCSTTTASLYYGP